MANPTHLRYACDADYGTYSENGVTYSAMTDLNLVGSSGLAASPFNASDLPIEFFRTTGGVPYTWLDHWYNDLLTADDYDNASASDTDGDGFTAEQEYIANTDPTNAASSFSVIVAAPAEGDDGFELSWESHSGRVYSVWGTTDLQEPFELWASDLVYPDDSYIDRSHLHDKSVFYIVEVKLDEDD